MRLLLRSGSALNRAVGRLMWKSMESRTLGLVQAHVDSLQLSGIRHAGHDGWHGYG